MLEFEGKEIIRNVKLERSRVEEKRRVLIVGNNVKWLRDYFFQSFCNLETL
jgi:hypothetical protein